ncbi:MAG: hypothetical protein AAFQ74_17700 [Cyanobacteria bacterium J06623_4]
MPDFKAFDNWRIYHLYQYLCGRLAMSRNTEGHPVALSIATRLGRKNFRKTVKQLFAQEHRWQGTIEQGGSVTTGAIVQMLSELRKQLRQDYFNNQIPYSRVLTTEDTLIALHQLTALTPEECTQLGLPKGDGLTLLRQMLLRLRAEGGFENYDVVFRAYKQAVGLNFSASQSAIENLSGVDELIKKTVKAALAHLPDKPGIPPSRRDNRKAKSPGKQETIEDLTRKAQKEVRRLLTRSGNTRVFLRDSETEHPYIRHYLRPAFVQKLAQTVVSNERLTQQFPVYLKRVTMEACGPLPFANVGWRADEAGDAYMQLLNPILQSLDKPVELDSAGRIHESGPSDEELASQEPVKITVEFYIRVPSAYEGTVPEIFEEMVSSRTRRKRARRRVDFALTSTGIGGTLSHMIKVINLMLLRDIPCLGSFFPIAHDITSTQQIVRDNVASPVWAHSLVQLCYNQAVGQALQRFGHSLSPYEDGAFSDPIGHGDFCGFDFLLAQAQAALQARLQAVCNTGVNPEEYLVQLCERTEKLLILEKAWSSLKRYPFSSMAMIGTLHKSIIGSVFGKRPLKKNDPSIWFDAYLSIAEALLDEGAYRASYFYIRDLSVLDGYVQQGLSINRAQVNSQRQELEIFSGSLIVRYLICLANYYYLYDREDDRSGDYLLPGCTPDINRQVLVQKAWAKLEEAKKHVEVRLIKYIVVREPSQGIFNPHYLLLGRIYFTRAKLLTFFSQYVPNASDILHTEDFGRERRTEASTHWGRLYLIEKARLYAAADGDGEVYSCYSAMQCYLYLAAAFAKPKNLGLPGRKEVLSPAGCLQWARTLRNHALVAYAKTGQGCYYDIKEKSGLPDENDEYIYGERGLYRIGKIPGILEVRGAEHERPSQENDAFITLDISLLVVESKMLEKLTPQHPTDNIYLFGTNACYLFFARGVYLLCSDETEEFEALAPGAEIDWEQKLKRAIRLLNMAWAIAEDGCLFENVKETVAGERKNIRQITRSFTNPDSSTQYTSQEISSVRDLYPRRVNEIADLGKIFSAACMVLRLQTAPDEERSRIQSDIEKILDMLYGSYRLPMQKTLRALLRKQGRYNGHLQEYLSQASTIIRCYALNEKEDDYDLNAYRNAFMSELFGALLGPG